MLNSIVINQINTLSIRQRLDLMKYSIRKLGKAKYHLLVQHYIQKKTDKEVGEKRDIPVLPNVIYRERTKFMQEYAAIILENYRLGLGYYPDSNY